MELPGSGAISSKMVCIYFKFAYMASTFLENINIVKKCIKMEKASFDLFSEICKIKSKKNEKYSKYGYAGDSQ